MHGTKVRDTYDLLYSTCILKEEKGEILSALYLMQKARIETVMKIEILRVSISLLMSLKLAYRG